MNIPKAVIDRDKEGVENLTYYGIPVTDLDRDGLLAALNQATISGRLSSDSHKRTLAFYADLRKQEQADYVLSGGLIGRR